MPQGKENGSGGSFGKYALESQGSIPPVYVFLDGLGIRDGITRMVEVQINGHHISKTWIGTPVEVKKISRRSVSNAGGTGFLEVVGDGGRLLTQTYFNKGLIIRETRGIDRRQGRMRLEIDEK